MRGLRLGTGVGSASGRWTPARIASSDLKGWWAAGEKYAYSSEGTGTSHAASWTSKIKNRVLSHSNSSPFIETSDPLDLGGADYLTFDGVNDYLQDTNFTFPGNKIIIACFCYIVNAGDTGGRIISIGDKDDAGGDALDTEGLVIRRTGTDLQAYANGAGSSTVTVGYHTWALAVLHMDGAAGHFRVNGQQIGANLGNPAGYSGVDTLRLFQQVTTGVDRQASGGIGDLIIATGDQDATKFEGYLAHTRGKTALLPAGHPYKNAAPRR